MEVGTTKIYYDICSEEQTMDCSVLGIQKGDTITKYETLSTITPSIVTLDQFASDEVESHKSGSIFGLVMGLLITILGVRKLGF